MKKVTKFIAAALMFGLVGSASAAGVCKGSSEVGYIGGSLFATDSAKPDASQMWMLQNAFQKLAASGTGNNYIWIRVAGSADSRGSVAHNMDLSKRRVLSVHSALADAGAKKGMFHLVAYGENKPQYTNKTADGMHKNRSALVTMYAMDYDETHRCYRDYPQALDPWVD